MNHEFDLPEVNIIPTRRSVDPDGVDVNLLLFTDGYLANTQPDVRDLLKDYAATYSASVCSRRSPHTEAIPMLDAKREELEERLIALGVEKPILTTIDLIAFNLVRDKTEFWIDGTPETIAAIQDFYDLVWENFS